MAQGQVRGGALRVREAHKSINPEGRPQRFRGDRESIPTTINFLKMNQSLPVRLYFVPHSRDFEGLGGQGVPPPGGNERMAQGKGVRGVTQTT